MDAGVWVGIASGVIALGALAHSIVSARAERRDRQAQIELLREQRADERRDRDEQRRANLHAEQGPSGGGERSDAYEMRVTNAGPATARELEGQGRNDVGDVVARSAVTPSALMAGGKGTVWLDIQRALSRAGGLRFWLVWRDDSGEHEQDCCAIEPVSRMP
jgi:ligand-binding sensor domain-containing protein